MLVTCTSTYHSTTGGRCWFRHHRRSNSSCWIFASLIATRSSAELLLWSSSCVGQHNNNNKQPLVVVSSFTRTHVCLHLRILLLVLCVVVGIFEYTLLPSVVAMRIVVQRVKSASVSVDGVKVSEIGPGILALVGLHEMDTEIDLQYCCKKLMGCKLWSSANNENSLWRQSVQQKSYECLCVSQFTLYGTLSKKNQPDYKLAMKSIRAEPMYHQFLDMLRSTYTDHPERIKDGVFGAMMDVELVNDGPVTIVIDSNPTSPPPPPPQVEEFDNQQNEETLTNDDS